MTAVGGGHRTQRLMSVRVMAIVKVHSYAKVMEIVIQITQRQQGSKLWITVVSNLLFLTQLITQDKSLEIKKPLALTNGFLLNQQLKTTSLCSFEIQYFTSF